MSRTCVRTGRNLSAKRGAFTLIEVLVVVAIIALLISILLPSLKHAREMARLTVCLTHQKNMGNAMQMYWSDNKDSMPGPIHPMFLTSPEDIIGKNVPIDTEEKKFVVKGYLNTRLRKYMGDATFGKGNNMKDVGVDPSFPIADQTFRASGILPFHYAINSSELTAPWLYFGFTHGGIKNEASWRGDDLCRNDPVKIAQNSPKPLGKIFNGKGPGGASWKFSPSVEWLMADAFRRPLRAKQAGAWPTQDEPGNEAFSDLPSPVWKENAQWGSLSNKVHGSGESASAKIAPFSPYHAGGGFQKKTSGETVYKGKVATLYFDLHAAAQEGWSGTKFERRKLGSNLTMRD